MVHAVDDEAGQGQAAGGGAGFDAAEHAHTFDPAEALQHPAAQRELVVEHLVEAELEQRLDGDPERDRADHVRRAGLLAVRQVGPDRVVPRDDAYRPAAHDLRRAREEVTWRDEHPGAVRRVHLVTGQGDEIQVAGVVRRPDLDAVMRRELRRVDRDPRAVAMRKLGHLVNRGHEAGDVRGAAQCHQTDPAAGFLQSLLDGVQVDVPFVGEPDHHVSAPVPPGQEVGVVLHLRDEDLTTVEPRLLGGDPVERVGRALDEDHDLVLLVDPQELRHQVSRLLVRLGREARFVAGAAVHAGVEVGEAVHDVAHAGQGRRAGGVVEVDPRDRGAAEEGHRQVDPGKVLAPLAGMM